MFYFWPPIGGNGSDVLIPSPPSPFDATQPHRLFAMFMFCGVRLHLLHHARRSVPPPNAHTTFPKISYLAAFSKEKKNVKKKIHSDRLYTHLLLFSINGSRFRFLWEYKRSRAESWSYHSPSQSCSKNVRYSFIPFRFFFCFWETSTVVRFN